MNETLEELFVCIAEACHEANRQWCKINGDHSQLAWSDAEEWQRDSAVKGVKFRFENPDTVEDTQHNAWMADKVSSGWIYGEVKDATMKTHPCIVPFNELPEFQQRKDALFCAICDSMLPKNPNFNPETVGTGIPHIDPMGLGSPVSDNELTNALNDGKRIRLKGASWYVFKQVPSTVPASIIPKMSSLPPLVKEDLISKGNDLNYTHQFCSVQPDGNIQGFSLKFIDDKKDWEILD